MGQAVQSGDDFAVIQDFARKHTIPKLARGINGEGYDYDLSRKVFRVMIDVDNVVPLPAPLLLTIRRP